MEWLIKFSEIWSPLFRAIFPKTVIRYVVPSWEPGEVLKGLWGNKIKKIDVLQIS